MVKLKGLGRGLDVLLGEEPVLAEAPANSLPRERLRPGKYQPRSHMDEAALATLTESIRANGIMQPILVRPIGADAFEIVAGERRWRAAGLAGLTEVPVVIRELTDREALAMALIENIQRESLNPLEEAQGITRLIQEFDLTHQEAADAVGRSRSMVSNLLRLLELAAPVQQLLAEGRIDMGHARALIALPEAEQIAVATLVAEQGLSVREAERLTRQAERPAPRVPAAAPVVPEAVRSFMVTTGLKVSMKTLGKGGARVVIDCKNAEEIERLLQHLQSKAE